MKQNVPYVQKPVFDPQSISANNSQKMVVVDNIGHNMGYDPYSGGVYKKLLWMQNSKMIDKRLE